MAAMISIVYAFCVAAMTVYLASAAPVALRSNSVTRTGDSAYPGLDFGVAGDGLIVQLKPPTTATRRQVTDSDTQHLWFGSSPWAWDGLRPLGVERREYDSLPELRFGTAGQLGSLSSSDSTLCNDIEHELHLKRQQNNMGRRSAEISSLERRLDEWSFQHLGFGSYGEFDGLGRGPVNLFAPKEQQRRGVDDRIWFGTMASFPGIADDEALMESSTMYMLA